MRLEVLKEALDELEEEKRLLLSTIEGLRSIINRAAKKPASTESGSIEETIITPQNGDGKSYVDLAEEAVRKAGKDLHIKKIVRHIEIQRGRPVKRNSIEATIATHIKKTGKNARLIKTETATYGLPRSREL